MDLSVFTGELDAAMALFVGITAPPLIAALVVGLVVGLLQAATQIQDQTLPLTFKVVAVAATLAVMSGVIFPPLLLFAERLLDQFPLMTAN